MSDKADMFLQDTEDGAFMYVSNPELYKRLCGYIESYHKEQMEKVLEEIHESHIDEASFQKHKKDTNALDKRYGFICGAKWLLEHLRKVRLKKGG